LRRTTSYDVLSAKISPTGSSENGYNSACMSHFSEIFAPNRGFSVSSYQMSAEFYDDRPWLPWQQNLWQLRL